MATSVPWLICIKIFPVHTFAGESLCRANPKCRTFKTTNRHGMWRSSTCQYYTSNPLKFTIPCSIVSNKTTVNTSSIYCISTNSPLWHRVCFLSALFLAYSWFMHYLDLLLQSFSTYNFIKIKLYFSLISPLFNSTFPK